MIGDLITWPMDIVISNGFSSFLLSKTHVTYTSEELGEDFHERFSQCQALFSLAGLQSEYQFAYMKRIILVAASSHYKCNPFSGATVFPCLSLNSIPLVRSNYYLSFMIIYSNTLLRLIHMHPWVYLAARNRISQIAERRAWLFFKKLEFVPYEGDLRRLGFYNNA